MEESNSENSLRDLEGSFPEITDAVEQLNKERKEFSTRDFSILEK